MSPAPSTTTIEDLVALLASANEPSIGFTGTYSEHHSGLLRRRWRIWRLRDLARVEDPPGHLYLLAGPVSYWQGAAKTPGDAPLTGPRTGTAISLPGGLWMQNPVEHWSEWLSSDVDLVLGTLRQVDHNGRPTWRFQAPLVKGGRPFVSVDAELGLVVQMTAEDRSWQQAWEDLQVLPSLEPTFFE